MFSTGTIFVEIRPWEEVTGGSGGGGMSVTRLDTWPYHKSVLFFTKYEG